MGLMEPGEELGFHWEIENLEHEMSDGPITARLRWSSVDEFKTQLDALRAALPPTFDELFGLLADAGVDQATIDTFRQELEAAGTDEAVLNELRSSIETSVGAGNVEGGNQEEEEGATALTTFAAAVFAAVSTLLF